MLFFLAGLCAVSLVMHVSIGKNEPGGMAAYLERLLTGENPVKETGGQRKYGYDWLRFLAAVLVLFVHAYGNLRGSLQAAGEYGAAWHVTTAVLMVSYLCNLLFVELSGALLLKPRQESALSFYLRRFEKVVIPLVFYYAFYQYYSGQLSPSFASLLSFLKKVISGPDQMVPHFWLVYVILGLYIETPLLRLAIKNMSEKSLLLLSGGILFLYAVNFAGELTDAFSFGASNFLIGYTGAFLTGYAVTHADLGRWERLLYAAGLLSLPVMIGLLWAFPEKTDVIALQSPFMLLAVTALMHFAEHGGMKKAPLLVRVTGHASYSVLMFHWFILFAVAGEMLGLTPTALGLAVSPLFALVPIAFTLIVSLFVCLILDHTLIFLLQQIFHTLVKLSPFGEEKP